MLYKIAPWRSPTLFVYFTLNWSPHRVLKVLCILLMVICFAEHALGQERKFEKDSICYNENEQLSEKSKLTRFIHRLIFNFIANRPIQEDKKDIEKTLKPINKNEGKIVRNIYITTLNPFGYSILDTSVNPEGFISKVGNQLHVKTRRKVISDLLLFKINEPFDSLRVKESERLIRSQNYIQDVISYTLASSPKADSLDVYIRVSDTWSILPSLSVSTSNLELGLTDDNFIGLGNSFHVDTKLNTAINGSAVKIGYLIPNYKDSHITGNVEYYFPGNNDLIKNQEFRKPVYSPVSSNLDYLNLSNRYLVKSLELSRIFYSPLAKWAGGIFIGQLITNQNYIQADSVRYLSSKTNIQDYWGARSWQLYKGNSLSAQTTNLIVSGRILKTRYPDRNPQAEAVDVFNNENIYFAGLGFTSRRYIQDRYIFNYGKVEDIPVGWAFGLTLGISVQHTNRYYLGLKAAWGNYYRFGYLSSNFEYGTLIGAEGWQQQVIKGRINYYTNLFSLGYWKLRQFIRPTVIFGINRLSTNNITLNDVMDGFEDLKYPATRLMALTLQTQSYSPLELYGFRFGPYIFSSFGMLGNSSLNFTNTRLYTVLGLGVLIKNNYLMINTFQVSMTFYPYLPGRGTNILNLNAYKTSDYGFEDFEISKLKVVDYR